MSAGARPTAEDIARAIGDYLDDEFVDADRLVTDVKVDGSTVTGWIGPVDDEGDPVWAAGVEWSAEIKVKGGSAR